MIKKRSLAIYSFSHFCVDFCCFYILYAGMSARDGVGLTTALVFLFYNLLAFGTQFLFGSVCDAYPRFPAGILGCALVAAGAVLAVMGVRLLSVGMCALGNAMFHSAGGIDSLVYSNGKLARSGIFVACGAPGVALGAISGAARTGAWLPLCMLAVCALLLGIFVRPPVGVKAAVPRAASQLGTSAVLALALGAIAVRAFVGFALPSDWKNGAALVVAGAVCACAGKALGGIAADRFGARTVGCAALAVSAPLLLFGGSTAWVALAGTLIFNFTMPINLCAVYAKLPDNPGLAFGLTTLALLCGVIPLCFIGLSDAAARLSCLFLCAAAFVFTWFSSAPREKNI